MTPEQQLTADRAAVMLAFSGGKEIERRYLLNGDWRLEITPKWDWACFDYRIKSAPPKPRRCWATYRSKQIGDKWGTTFCASPDISDAEIVPMIELTEQVRAAIEAAGIIGKEDV